MPIPIICLDEEVRHFAEWFRVAARAPDAAQASRSSQSSRRDRVFEMKLMETTIRSFEPVVGTLTHVLLDSWYSAKCLWRVG